MIESQELKAALYKAWGSDITIRQIRQLPDGSWLLKWNPPTNELGHKWYRRTQVFHYPNLEYAKYHLNMLYETGERMREWLNEVLEEVNEDE